MSTQGESNRMIVGRYPRREDLVTRFIPQEAPFPFGMPPEMAHLAREAVIEMLVTKRSMSRDAATMMADDLLTTVAPYFFGHA